MAADILSTKKIDAIYERYQRNRDAYLEWKTTSGDGSVEFGRVPIRVLLNSHEELRKQRDHAIDSAGAAARRLQDAEHELQRVRQRLASLEGGPREGA